MSKLVIVESPSKAKTIKKYLGKDYEIVASVGHVRDLPKARLCVDIKDNFRPKYAVIKGKEKLVTELKKAAKESDDFLHPYILKAVTEGLSYTYLKTRLEIPCSRDMYYDRYRRFFWLLSETRN